MDISLRPNDNEILDFYLQGNGTGTMVCYPDTGRILMKNWPTEDVEYCLSHEELHNVLFFFISEHACRCLDNIDSNSFRYFKC